MKHVIKLNTLPPGAGIPDPVQMQHLLEIIIKVDGKVIKSEEIEAIMDQHEIRFGVWEE